MNMQLDVSHLKRFKLLKLSRKISTETFASTIFFMIEDEILFISLHAPCPVDRVGVFPCIGISGLLARIFSSRFEEDVDLPPINYAEIAKSFGCHGEKIENPEDIKPAIQRAIESKKPAVIDVDIAFERSPPAMKIVGFYKKNKGLFG